VTLTEDPPDSGMFAGDIALGTDLSVAHGDTLTITYDDADTGNGQGAVVTATADLDCEPPVVSNIAISDVAHDSARVCWSTNKVTTGVVEYGDGTPLDGQVGSDTPGTDHCVTLSGLDQCTQYSIQVSATDEMGHVTVDDNNGNYHIMATPHSGRRAVFAEYLDSDPGWTTSGDWVFGEPRGLGGSDSSDPTSGFTGNNVYGNDLTSNGLYPNNVSNYDLTTPVIDLSSVSAPVELTFQRWLNVERSRYDQARVQAWDGDSWDTLYQNPDSTMKNEAWVAVSLDLSEYAGRDDLRIRWTLDTDESVQYSGWNIDDVVIMGTVPNPSCVNQEPVANAGADLEVDEGRTATLDGSASSDPDFDTLTYQWIQTGGEAVELDDPTAARPSFRAPQVVGDAVLTFELVVSDGEIDSDPDEVVVAVKDTGNWDFVQTATDTPISIPDNNSTGITSEIYSDVDGYVTELEVDVNITHTYQGDLRVRLMAPDGSYVYLHDRTGGTANDIHQTYAVTDLFAEVCGGTWTLRVSDHEGKDVGTLDSWTLRFNREVEPPRLWDIEESASGLPVTIPDNNSGGVSSTIYVADAAEVMAVEVYVDIDHTYEGDLRVKVQCPDGTQVTLHDRSGGSADDVRGTWSVNACNGQPANGNWRLLVSDHAARDVGTIDEWILRVRL
jgi:subtilisin-like proprotein convertase family protein